MGIKIIFLLFIFYSFLGWLMEVTCKLIQYKRFINRGFLMGPICPIYGHGAIIMLILLKDFASNPFILFVMSMLVCTTLEYLTSYFMEKLFSARWWDYSNKKFNINGRVCIAFSFFWGVLAIYLMSHLNPLVDKFLDKISPKVLKISVIIGIIIMLLDFFVTSFALKMFFTRLVNNYNLEIAGLDKVIWKCDELYKNEKISDFTYKYFSDEKMLKTFPNIKLTKKDGDIIYVSDILNNITPYYFRIFTPKY